MHAGMGVDGEQPSSMQVTAAVLSYCFCSAGMLIVNKLAVHHIPLPALLTVSQFASASVVVFGSKLVGCLEMDNFEWDRAKYFLVYVAFFTIGTYTNMKVCRSQAVMEILIPLSY